MLHSFFVSECHRRKSPKRKRLYKCCWTRKFFGCVSRKTPPKTGSHVHCTVKSKCFLARACSTSKVKINKGIERTVDSLVYLWILRNCNYTLSLFFSHRANIIKRNQSTNQSKHKHGNYQLHGTRGEQQWRMEEEEELRTGGPSYGPSPWTGLSGWKLLQLLRTYRSRRIGLG